MNGRIRERRMSKLAKLLSVVAFLSLCVVLLGNCQALGTSVVQANFELGGSAGIIMLPDASLSSLTTFGISGGTFVLPGVEIGLAFSRAGISFLGVELASISLLDGFACVDLMPAQRFGVLLRLGGTYILAEALGEGAGGFAALVGLGLRISPIDMLDLVAQCNVRLRNGLMGTVEAGIRVRF